MCGTFHKAVRRRGEDAVQDTDLTDDAPTALRVDGRVGGAGPGTRFVALAASPTPRLSWEAPRGDGPWTTSRVVVRDADGRTWWDGGAVAAADPWTVLPVELPPHGRWSWTVELESAAGRRVRSAPAVLETGPHGLGDWRTAWVSAPAGAVVVVPFVLDAAAVRARLHVTGQGLVRVRIDGADVNPHAVDPSRTDRARALYRTYDVTDLCGAGAHRVELVLGRGQWGATGLDPRVLAEVVVECADGSTVRAGTSADATTERSRVVHDEPYYLERHDLRLGDGGEPGLVGPAADAPRHVAVDPGPPVDAAGVAEGRPLAGGPGGIRVFDLGTNLAGRVTVRVEGAPPAGTVVRVVHGEHLDADGRVDTTNLRLPTDAGRERQVVEFVLAGGEVPPLEPWFAYHGARFVEVSGLPPEAGVRVEAHAVHSVLGRGSVLRSSSALVERLDRVARRTMLNNVHGMPEDCPTREQAGWTGDTASVVELEFAAYDVEAFHRKWLGDLRTSQGADGSVPAVAPHVTEPPVPSDPVWGSALPRVLLAHWLHYGDPRILDDGLPMLRRWADCLAGWRGERGVVEHAPISYGHDWLGLHQTPPELHHTAAAIETFETLARLESAVGEEDAASAARSVAADLRRSARRVFVETEPLAVANGSQGSLALAIGAGLLTADERAAAGRRLVAAIRREGDRVTSGFATTRAVVRALAAVGADQAVFDVLRTPDEPGVGAMLAGGPGTFWECWWIDPANTGTGSLDHLGLGGPFAGWLWTSLVGVRPVAPGYAVARVDPRPVAGVDDVSATIPTVRGDLRVAWRRAGAGLVLDLDVPDTMRVEVGEEARHRGAGRHRIELPLPATPATMAPSTSSGTTRSFVLPVRAPRASDLDRDPDLLAAAIEAGAVRPDAGTVVDVLPDGLHCMPVPHEQEHGPVLRLTGTDRAAITIELPLDLSDARFLAIRMDTDLPVTARPLEPLLELHAADGSTRAARTRLWPAGWSRVAVDLEGWTGRDRVERIVVGIRASGEPDGMPAAVHLGGLGRSGLRRLW
jgi:alpha-L-rhamnosidase